MSITTKVTWNGDILKQIGEKAIDAATFAIGIVIQGQAVLLCPYDLGRLRGSIIVKSKTQTNLNSESGKALQEDFINEPNENHVVFVGTNVEYGIYQEFGTRKMRAQPYLRPAIDLTLGKALNIAEVEGRKEFSDYLGAK